MNDEHLRGHLLAKENSGEKFLKLALLDETVGVVWFLLRVVRSAPKKTVPAAAPDIFDHAEVTLTTPRNGGGVRFATEYRLLRRHADIGTDYERLATASHFARILARNPPPPDCLATANALCARAFAAFANRPRPDVTLLKSLWRLALDGGWPVREHWFETLIPADAALLASALRTPLDMQPAPPAALAPLLTSLLRWLEHECHFLPA